MPSGTSYVPLREEKSPQAERLLKFYVAGRTPGSTSAFVNLKHICEAHLNRKHPIEVVDLMVNTTFPKDNQIVTVPALVRQLPPPVKKIVGNLASEERVLVGLDVKSV